MKLPPHNAQAEAAFLGAILLRGREALTEAETLVSIEDFYRPQNQAVFRAMRILGERGQQVDVITVDAQLRRTGEADLVGGLEALASLDRHASAQQISAHAAIIREHSRARMALAVGRGIAEDLAGGVEDVDEYLARRIAELQGVAEHGRQSARVWQASDVNHMLFGEKVEDAKGARPVISTGIPQLDGLLKGGGLQTGQLIVIGGRPKMGKTSLALSLTRECVVTRRPGWPTTYRNRERDKAIPVLWACDEMRATQVHERLVADIAGLDGRELGRPSLRWLTDKIAVDKDGKPGPLAHAEQVFRAAPFWYVDDRDTHHLGRIFAAARAWRAEHTKIIGRDKNGNPKREPAVLVLDYLQRFADLPSSSRSASKTERVGDKVQLCKNMALELDLVVILLSQLNRELEKRTNKRPVQSDFRDSGEIEQEADVLLACYRDHIYDDSAVATESQVSNLTERAHVPPGELALLLAHHAEEYQFADSRVREIRQRCKLTPGALDELVSAKRKISDTELIVISNRHGPAGVAHADFIGEHYRFQPRGDLT